MLYRIFFLLLAVLIPSWSFPDEIPQANYLLGYNEGQTMKGQSYTLSYNSLEQGLLDGYSNHVPEAIEDQRSSITQEYVEWVFNKQTDVFTSNSLKPKVIDTFSYFVGVDYGKDFRQKSFDLDAKSFAHGVQDSMEGKPSLYNDTTTNHAILDRFYSKAQRIKSETQNNKSMELVQGQELSHSLPGGITYALLKPGTKSIFPTLKSRVTIQYNLSLLDKNGNIINLMAEQKASLNIQNLAKGSRTAILNMQPGEHSLFNIPTSLLFTDNENWQLTHTLLNVTLISIDSFPSQNSSALKQLPEIMGTMPSSLDSSRLLPQKTNSDNHQNKTQTQTKK